MNTDPIADYLTRVRNAISAKHRVVDIPASNTKQEITKILFDKGYILNYKFEDVGHQGNIKIAFVKKKCIKIEIILFVNFNRIKLSSSKILMIKIK